MTTVERPKVTMAMVISLDGRITIGDTSGTSEWASPEDQASFKRLRDENEVIIMGSGTWDSSKELIKPDSSKLRVVLTHSPEKYKEYIKPGLEFSDEEPNVLLSRLAVTGIKTVLLVGGGQTNSRFLQDEAVDELAITVEPVIFGSGKLLVDALPYAVSLKLMSTEQLNDNGTLFMRYLVEKGV